MKDLACQGVMAFITALLAAMVLGLDQALDMKNDPPDVDYELAMGFINGAARIFWFIFFIWSIISIPSNIMFMWFLNRDRYHFVMGLLSVWFPIKMMVSLMLERWCIYEFIPRFYGYPVGKDASGKDTNLRLVDNEAGCNYWLFYSNVSLMVFLWSMMEFCIRKCNDNNREINIQSNNTNGGFCCCCRGGKQVMSYTVIHDRKKKRRSPSPSPPPPRNLVVSDAVVVNGHNNIIGDSRYD